MKNILKYLTVAGVLILFLPFFRMCSGTKPAEQAVAIDSVAVSQIDTINESTYIYQDKIDSVQSVNETNLKQNNSFSNKISNFCTRLFVEDNSLTGFGLGLLFPLSFSSVEFNKETIVLVFFFLILLNSLALILLSFLKKVKTIQTFACLNIFLLITSYILMNVYFNQILFGSYLFVINSLLIIYFSIKHKKIIKNKS
ncbi:MAG: hypothetical protein QM751_02635 [Paludibacteraceae bacterium]